MKRTLSRVFFALLIVCLGASLLMIAPIDDADAWKYHPCCDWKHDWFVNGNIIEVYWHCEHIHHPDHWLSCGFVCP